MLMCLCINVLIQHFYDWVSFNDTLPHTLVSWQPLSIMAQSFRMLFYMWEGNKMFCITSQVFLKQFQMLIIQYTAWNRMAAASAYDELESYAHKLCLKYRFIGCHCISVGPATFQMSAPRSLQFTQTNTM